MSRIGTIRDIITKAGGRSNFAYYVDGPKSSMGITKGKGKTTQVVVKIERTTDGLTSDDARRAVLQQLALLPDVEYAYLSSPGRRYYQTQPTGPHMKIVFSGSARKR